MQKSTEVKLQYLVDSINSEIMDIETTLVSDTEMSKSEEENYIQKSETLQSILRRIEELFEDIIYNDD